MNGYLASAGILAIVLGLVHSILGEVLVFQKLRNKQNMYWIAIGSELPIRSIRILWASWHVVTVFGIAIGVIVLQLAQATPEQVTLVDFFKTTILIAIAVAGLIVLFGTRGRHPGWLVLLIISMLIWVA